MLLIVVAWPYVGRDGHILWPYVGAFAVYNALVDRLRHVTPRLGSWRWVPFLDLPVAAVLFYLDFEPGGPLFLSFFIGVTTAALCWPLRASALYAVAASAAVVVVAPTLPDWTASSYNLRQLASRIAVLLAVGIGTALLRRQLERQAALTQASHDAAAQLGALEKARAEFLASISHDLKTPLTAAQAGLGMLETSGAQRLHANERDLLGNAQRSIQRLGFLIDDLLAHNQLAAGALQIDAKPLDLRQVVANARASVDPLIQQKEQTLVIDVPSPLPIAGDAQWLEQAVVNVLANAHRHTPPGARITVTGHVFDDETRLTIADNGPGIPPEEHERIFQRFYRRSQSQGSGLGLAIARDLIELHGGRLWVTSSPGQGAVFHVALPIRHEPPTA